MVGGIGMALLEGTQLDYRDGRIVNANMSDYLVPVNADVPALDAVYLPAEDTIADPLGVKGLGELVIVGVPAAIANAVFNATGTTHHRSAHHAGETAVNPLLDETPPPRLLTWTGLVTVS